MIKMVVSDLDGSLLDQNGQLNPEFFEVYKELNRRGVLFVAASGRGYFSIRKFFESVTDNIYYIANNGALLLYKEKLLHDIPIDSRHAYRVAEIIEEENMDLGITISSRYKVYYYSQYPELFEGAATFFKDLVKVNSLNDIREEQYQIGLYADSNAARFYDRIKDEFEGKLRVIRSGENWVDMMNPAVTKGNMLSMLQDDFGITKAETMVFGDYHNDLEMLDCADYSYAMGNADDIVKKRAKFICKPNYENGVLEEIKRMFNL